MNLKSHLVWRFADRVTHTAEETALLLVPVILDIYRVMLGPVDAVRLPTYPTHLGLAAANHIASSTQLFKYATEDQLLTLARYKKEVAGLIERVATGAYLTEEASDALDDQSFEEWQKEALKNLRDTVWDMGRLEELYEQYLHIEDVKIKPHVYYPWLLGKLAPFWQKMQWEVGPGNRPSPDIRNLHAVLEDHIKNKLVVRDGDYPEDFDVFNEGHLDTLLLECYERMVVPHDIQYNTTVWQDGLSFMHTAAALMPEKVLEKFIARFPNNKAFLTYLGNARTRWNESDE